MHRSHQNVLLLPYTTLFRSGVRFRYANLLPSGDHDGLSSNAFGLFVRFTGLDPSAFITQTSPMSARRLWNAIFAPLGDQAASASSAGLLVRLTSPVPFTLMRKISKFDVAGSVLRSKAI